MASSHISSSLHHDVLNLASHHSFVVDFFAFTPQLSLWAPGYHPHSERRKPPPAAPTGEPHPCSQRFETSADRALQWYEENCVVSRINVIFRMEVLNICFTFTTVSGGEHNTEFLHAWKEWSQHGKVFLSLTLWNRWCLSTCSACSYLCFPGVSAETHQMLEQALCLTGLHGAAQATFITPGFLLLSPFISMVLLLLSWFRSTNMGISYWFVIWNSHFHGISKVLVNVIIDLYVIIQKLNHSQYW